MFFEACFRRARFPVQRRPVILFSLSLAVARGCVTHLITFGLCHIELFSREPDAP